MKRQRGRGRRSSGNNNNPNRHFESNGPDVKIRGSAQQILDKYLQYARDAQTSGDRVNAENYFQHAEHYARIVATLQPKEKPRRQEDAAPPAQSGEEPTKADAQEPTADGSSNPPPVSNEDSADALKVIDAAPTPAVEAGGSEGSDGSAEEPTLEKPRRRRTYRKRSESTDEAAATDDGVMKTLSRGRRKSQAEAEAEAVDADHKTQSDVATETPSKTPDMSPAESEAPAE